MSNSQTTRVAVVTGASSGIGRATVEALLAREYAVLAVSRREWPGSTHPQLSTAQADVRDGAQLRDAILAFAAEVGPVDLLVNNAGIMSLGKIDSQDPEEWAALFDTNAISILHASQAVLPSMVERTTGTIVTISSIAGRNVYANHTAYSGTKFAAHAMMESMRREYAAHGVRFTTIAPGVVDTNLLDSVSSQEIVDGYEAMKVRIGGGLVADDIASAITYIDGLPQRICIREHVIAPTSQES
ncbi:MAG: SDR family oxidoreductase [Leucobacter sp.]